MVVPNRLREFRDERGLSRNALAEAMQTTERTIARYEFGESAIPDELKMDLARYFGVSVSALMGWPESRPPPEKTSP